MFLYVDIETIPDQREGAMELIAASIFPPGNYTKPDTIAKWEEEKKPALVEEAWRKTALNGAEGELLCASLAWDDEPPQNFMRKLGESEADLLVEINGFLKSGFERRNNRLPTWVGHYITGFDLRFLFHRHVVNQIKPAIHLPYDAKPWSDRVFDTKVEWSGLSGYTGSSSMTALCRAFGIDGKGDIDGSKIWDAVLEGRYQDIADYCDDDVNRARIFHKRLTFA